MSKDSEIEEAWLRVRRAGRDLEPRRRLATLLTAHGDPLGEFITLCLSETEGLSEPERRRRFARAEALLRQHGPDWFPVEPGDKGQGKRQWTEYLGRGMPDAVAVYAWGPPAHDVLASFTARYPLRRVGFVGVDPAEGIRLLEEKGLVAVLEELNFDGCTFSDATVEALTRASAGPRSVQITKPVGLEGARAERLFRGGPFLATTRVGIASAPLDTACLRGLWGWLPALDDVMLYRVEFPRAELGLVGGLPRRLTSLSLEAPARGRQTAELLESIDLRALRRLKLRVDGALDGVFALLRERSQRGELSALVELDLESNNVNDAEIAVFLEQPPPVVARVNLAQNRIGPSGMTALSAWARRSPSLVSLAIDGNFIGSGVFAASTDWDGSVGGSHELAMTTEEMRARFDFPGKLALH